MFKKDKKAKDQIILENSLQCFFFDELERVNKKSSSPLSKEAIYYSSLVLDKYGCSNEYFEKNDDGRVREKLLGIKLLEAKDLPKKKKTRAIQDIAETSLMLCGYFSDSVNNRFNQISYYEKIGRSAYGQLNSLVPSFYDLPEFYHYISCAFSEFIKILSMVSRKLRLNDTSKIIFLQNNCKEIKVA